MPATKIQAFSFPFRSVRCSSTHCLWKTALNLPGCWEVLSPTRKETNYSDQTLTSASHSKKKNYENYPSNQVSAATVTSASDEKWRPFSRMGLRTYQHPCIAVTATWFDSKPLLTERKNVFCAFTGFGLIPLNMGLYMHAFSIPSLIRHSWFTGKDLLLSLYSNFV